MLPSVEDSFIALFASTSFLDTLPFQETKGRIADAALAPAELFEGQYIRDAHEHELGLFSTEEGLNHGVHAGPAGSSLAAQQSVNERDERARHRRSLLGRSTSGSTTSRNQNIGSSDNNGIGGSRNSWNFPKSRGPARIGAPEKATPLKKRRAQPAQNKSVVDPEAYLLAARKLLQTYPMQRASEHVELLYSQYEGLVDAIADIEETLQQSQPKASTSAMTIEASVEEDLATLQAEIRREELEILALKEARKELDKEVKQAEAKARNGTSSSSIMQNRPSSRQTSRPAPQPVKMPSIKDASKPSVKPPASAPTSATTIGGRRVPDVVARRMAEQKAAAASAATASSGRSSKTPSPPVAVTKPKVAATSSVPALNVQSPSNTSMANDGEEEDDDQTIVIGGRDRKDAADSQDRTEPAPQKRQLQPRLPAEQFDKILAKIISALPGNVKKSTSKDAESVLSSLTNVISRAESGISSPTSSVSASSVTASPTSSSLTPVNIIELHLLHTFLSLLVSLELEASTDSKDKLSLILRRPNPASSTGTPTASSAAAASSSGDNNAPEPFLNMNNLKIYLGGKAKEKGLNEDLGHKAIYGLVAKRILKIDRKGREALVGFL